MPKEVLFNSAEGPQVLEFVDSAIPIPGKKEVIVEMKAAGLNRSEYMFLTGTYVFKPQFPSRIGTEGSGIINAVGAEVKNFKIGDKVCIIPNILPYEYGVMSEYVKVPVEALTPKPEQLTFEQAASVWMAWSTAYFGLVIKGGLKARKRQTVLVSAASSSVGVAVIQMAKRYGAKVIATSRTREKEMFLKKMGADYVIATNDDDLVDCVNEFTSGKGFDIGFDMVAGDMIEKLAEAAAPSGTLLLCGLLSMEVPHIPFLPLVMKNLSIKSFHVVLHLFRDLPILEQAKQHILEGLKDGAYSAQIDKVFPFEKLAEGYTYLANSSQKGKVVIKF